MSQQRNTQEQKAILSEIEKELQAETSKEAAPLLEFVLENIQKIIIGLVAIVAIIALFGFMQWKNDTTYEKANKEFQQITALSSPSQKAELLTTFAKSAPKDLQIAISLELAKAYMQDNKLEDAANTLTSVLNKEKNSPLATSLAFAISDIYVKNNNPSEGLAILEEHLKVAPKNVIVNILEEITFVATLAQNNERVISAYTTLLSMPEASQSYEYYQEKLTELSK